MRFTSGAAALLLVAFGRAQAADSSSPSAEVDSASSSSLSKPTFTPTALKAPFLEQFTDDWDTRWKASHAKKDDKSTDEEWAYIGTWSVEEPTVLKGMEGDKGLVIKDKAAHHAISAKFPKAIDNKGKALVVQYEVKLQDGLECGGAYMKLLQDNKALHAEEFSNASPYMIMFGPDKCGATNKVHFIFRHKHPKTGQYEEKHLKNPPMARIVKTTTLYTLIVQADNTFEIKIDGVSSRNGTLLDDFAPPVNPEKEIDDPKDQKPDDWVDDARILDPDASKPEDWDEDAPFEILDEDAAKPNDWLDDEPATVPDPDAEKPDDWDDEEDGDWIPPTVPNPKCDEVSGCGEWKPPMKKNPEYKGPWSAPYIDNPAFKGAWKPRKIKNPEFFEDKHPSKFEPMGGIGFEIWTMQKDILFDNIYIGHSVEDAEQLRMETFGLKQAAEKAEEEALAPTPSDTPKPTSGLDFRSDPMVFIKNKFNLFVALAQKDPLEAVKTMPEVAGAMGVAVITVMAVLISTVAAGGSTEQTKRSVKTVKEAATDAKEKTTEATTSGADKVQADVSKRTTRSSAS